MTIILGIFIGATIGYLTAALMAAPNYSEISTSSTTKDNLAVDCIDRQATLDAIIKRLGIKNETYLLEAERAIYQQILAMPSVTPQEPRKGKWMKTPKAVMGEGYMWYCNKCEHQVYQDSSRDYPSEKYCPNCGADMRGRGRQWE